MADPLDRLFDNLEPKARRQINRAIKSARSKVTTEMITESVRRGRVSPRLAAALNTLPTELRAAVGPVIETAVVQAGAASLRRIVTGVRFDITNPLATEAAGTITADLVKQVSRETKKSLRVVLQQAFEDRLPPSGHGAADQAVDRAALATGAGRAELPGASGRIRAQGRACRRTCLTVRREATQAAVLPDRPHGDDTVALSGSAGRLAHGTRRRSDSQDILAAVERGRGRSAVPDLHRTGWGQAPNRAAVSRWDFASTSPPGVRDRPYDGLVTRTSESRYESRLPR